MKRKLNFTDRSRIPQERVSVRLNREGGSVKSFTATLDLNGFVLPPEAKVYLDAYRRSEYKRFDYGTVGNRTQPRSTSLSDLAYSENLKFRVLVVDESSSERGLILAHADRLRPVPEGGKRPILPVDFSRDLGNQIWIIEYEGDDGEPVLYINKRIPDAKRIAESDPGFIMHVYPAVLREVLTHMIFVQGVESPDEPEMDWQGDWLDYCSRILTEPKPPKILDPDDNDFDADDVELWINRIVEEFCSSKNDQWKGYVEQLVGGREQS